MTTAEWTLRRFPHVVPVAELSAEELKAVGAWLGRLAANLADCGGILLPSDHLGTTYPEEREDHEA